MIGLKFGPLFRQYVIVVTANLAFFQFGITVGWMSPSIVRLRDANQTTLPEPITDTEAAWISSTSSLGALSVPRYNLVLSLGLIVKFSLNGMNILTLLAFAYTGYIANNLGRKYSIIVAVTPRVVCCFLLLFASKVWMLMLGRAICGISDMFVIIIIATYSSEIASKEIRGGLGTVSQICSAIGSMLMLSIGPYVSFYTINVIQTCAIVSTVIPLLFLPESPYFLYSKGKIEEAVKILTYLRGDSTLAHEELKDYSKNTVETIALKNLVTDKVFLKTLCIILVLGISSQMTGYNAVMFNLQTIFDMTGTTVAPEISSVIIGFIQLFACTCTILLTDKFGRKPVLTITFFCSAVGMIGLGIFFNLKEGDTEITGFLNYLPLISMILVIFCFNAGVGALVWLLMAELFDGPSRAVGVSIGAFNSMIFTFLTIRYFASVTVAIGPAATYWIFSGCCFASCLFIATFVPETKGKAFSQIQWELGRR